MPKWLCKPEAEGKLFNFIPYKAFPFCKTSMHCLSKTGNNDLLTEFKYAAPNIINYHPTSKNKQTKSLKFNMYLT